MSTKLDLRKLGIIVVDSALIQHAVKEEVIKLVADNNEDPSTTVINIISDSLGISISERELYKELNTVIKSIGYAIIKEVVDICVQRYYKTDTTYKRAIEGLHSRGIIKYDNTKTKVTFVNSFDTSSISNSGSKFIVIELR